MHWKEEMNEWFGDAAMERIRHELEDGLYTFQVWDLNDTPTKDEQGGQDGHESGWLWVVGDMERIYRELWDDTPSTDEQ